jgi:Uma2 family endonuclease
MVVRGSMNGGPAMALGTEAGATLDDLYRTRGKAELIAGKIVELVPSGDAPSSAAFRVAILLDQHARNTGVGAAFPDGVGYALDSPLASGRRSFCPDASYHVGPRPNNRMRFIDGPPIFAVEVRSENDYSQSAELEMAAKRADYLEAGTEVVWDVDPMAGTIAVYRADPNRPEVVYARGEIAEAEPAVRGWRVAVDDIFS